MIGRIYYLRCDETNDVYIGSTIQTLKERLRGHIKDKYCTSKLIIKYDSCIILLLEEIEVENRKELEKIERQYIETYVCVNKMIPGRTDKEYRNDNKIKIAKKDKEIYKLNKIQILEKQKIYAQKNKIEIAKKQKEKYTCECGSIFRKYDKARHEKSKFHINFCLNK